MTTAATVTMTTVLVRSDHGETPKTGLITVSAMALLVHDGGLVESIWKRGTV
jgi:hypothetical protein